MTNMVLSEAKLKKHTTIAMLVGVAIGTFFGFGIGVWF